MRLAWCILALLALASCSPYVDDTAPEKTAVAAAPMTCQQILGRANMSRCVDDELGVVCYVYGPAISDDGGRALDCLPIPISGGEE